MRSLAIAAGCYARGGPQRGGCRRSGHGGGHARVGVRTRGNDPRREVPPRSTARSRPGAGPPRHGRRRGIAVGGGVGTLLVVVVLALLGVDVTGGGSGGSPDPFSLGTGSDSAAPATELSAACRTGADANQREDCRIVGVVNSVQAYWGDRVQGYREAPTRFFSGQTQTGVRPGDVGGRAVLLPGRPDRLHRPRLLPRAAHALRRARRRVRRGLRHRPRVRPPRPAPARHRPAGRAGERAAARPPAPCGSSCRPTATRASGPRTPSIRASSRTSRRPTSPTGSTPRPRSATTGSSSARPGASNRGVVDPRVVGPAAAVVPDRLPRRRPEPMRHVRRRRALTGRAARRPPVRRTIPRPPRV